jgi:hypothetical protein
MRGALLIVVAYVVGCGSPGPPTAAPEPSGPNDAWPTREEVLAYLDGKSVPLSVPNQLSGADDKGHVLKREQIEALEVKTSGGNINGGAWSTEVNFLLNTGTGRYAVSGTVEHRLIENTRAFFGFRVREVSKQ